MRIDYGYLKTLLTAFLDAPEPETDIQDLATRGVDYTEGRFLFHLELLHDGGLVTRRRGEGVGYTQGADGEGCWSVVPLRLTKDGHDFATALCNDSVWKQLQDKLKDATFTVAIELAKHTAKQVLLPG